MPRILTTTRSDAAFLQDTEGQPYAVTPDGDVSPGPDSPFAFVNVVTTFGVDNTGAKNTSSQVQAAFNTLAGTGQAAWFPPGTYKFAAPVNLPSNLLVWSSPSARYVNAQAFTGSQTANIFTAKATSNGNAGTLHANAVLGVSSVSVTMPAKPTVGNYLAVSQSLSQQTFLIMAVAGVGPYTVTLDRPVLLPFTAVAASVSEDTSVPTNIRLLMNGASCTGTGDRIIELVTAFQCIVCDWHYDTKGGAVGDIVFGGDIGGYRTGFVRCTVDGTGAAGLLGGLSLESIEQGFMLECGAANVPVYAGCIVVDCIEPYLADCWSRNVADGGLAWGTDGSLGTVGGLCVGFSSYGDTYGLVLNGSAGSRFVGCAFKDATNTGVIFNATGINDTQFEACAVDGSASGLVDASGANAGTCIRGMTFNGCTVQCMATASDVDMSDFRAAGLSVTMTAFAFSSGSLVRLRSGEVVHTGIVNALAFTGVTRAEVDGVKLTSGSAASEGLEIADGVVIARNVVCLGAFAAGAAVGAGATFRQGDGCNLDIATTPVSVAGGAFWTRGAVVANGAANVAVAWPDLKATDRVVLTMATKGGSPTAMPLVTYTPATGFTVQSYALDTSTYGYQVQ